MCVLDAGMINVGLPDISQALSVSPSQAVWVVNAYGLIVAMTLLPFASMAERVGFRRVFSMGLVLFIVGGILSALAQSLPTLLIGRVLQGLGASGVMCMTGAIMRYIFPSALLARGIGLNAMTVAVTSVIGPTLGSLILNWASWPWLFVAITPVALVALFGGRCFPEIVRTRLPFDYLSALLSALAIALLVFGLNDLGAHTWLALPALLMGAGLAAVLIRSANGKTAPLVPVDLLKIGAIRAAIAASGASFGVQMSVFVALPFFLQNTLGRDVLSVGLLMAGWPLGAAVMALVAGRLTERYPVAILCAIGAGAMLLGPALLLALPSTASDSWLLLAMGIAGVGFGFFQTPNNRVLLGSAPRERAGAVGGLQALTRVFGQTVGAALVATVFAMSPAHGPALGLWVGCLFALVALVINLRRHAQERGRLS